MSISSVVFVLAIILMLAFFVTPFIIAKRMEGTTLKPAVLDLLNLHPNQAQQLFYFFSPQCNNCHLMTPLLKRLQKHHPAIHILNVRDAMNIALQLDIRATPAIILIERNTIKKVLLGMQSERKIENLLATRSPQPNSM